MYAELRERALRTPPAEMGLDPTDEQPRVYGILMEMAYPNGAATLVCLADGSTSLYTSTGGGVIGGGQHDAVARATRAFVGAAAQFVDAMSPTTSYPAPAIGAVRFQVLTLDGGFTAQVEEQALGERRDRLSPLFYAGQGVLTQLRLLDATRPDG